MSDLHYIHLFFFLNAFSIFENSVKMNLLKNKKRGQSDSVDKTKAKAKRNCEKEVTLTSDR